MQDQSRPSGNLQTRVNGPAVLSADLRSWRPVVRPIHHDGRGHSSCAEPPATRTAPVAPFPKAYVR